MSPKDPILHMVCGKMASGKSTLARTLGARPGSVLIAEDDWLGVLFADRMETGADFLTYSGKLRAIMGPHVAALLKAGTTVVLDFQANTVDSRAWLKSIIDQTGAAHELHVFDVPDAVCLARLAARNAEGNHPFAPTEEQFYRFSKHFVLPSPQEGFNVVHHDTSD